MVPVPGSSGWLGHRRSGCSEASAAAVTLCTTAACQERRGAGPGTIGGFRSAWLLAATLVVGLAGGCGGLPWERTDLARLQIDRTEAAGRGGEAERSVVLISVDGLAPWVLVGTDSPTLDRLAREGTVARRAETIVPSLTLPSHTSMISGVGPERHGVLWNQWQPGSALEVDTIFTHCARARLRCGLFAGKEKFVHFARTEPGVERYRREANAEAVLDAALGYMDEAVPHFVMIHLPEVDIAGHRFGWGSGPQRRAIRHVDAAIDDFLDELLDEREGRVTLIVTADHGGRGRQHGSAAAEDVSIPWLIWGDRVPEGGQIPFVRTVDTAATILSLLGRPVPEDWVGKSHHPFYVHAEGGAP